MSLRVVIADDQPMMRAGFKAVLEASGDIVVVAEAGNGAEAVEAANRHAPDAVLMDIRMPVMDGIEAARQIVVSETSPRVLVLTTFDLDEVEAFLGCVLEQETAGAGAQRVVDASRRSGSWPTAARSSRPRSRGG